MDDLTRTILDIAYGPLARSKLEVAEHYRSMLLEAQEANDLCRGLETDYAATMERIDARQEDPEYAKWLDRINQCNDEQPDPMEDQGYDEQI